MMYLKLIKGKDNYYEYGDCLKDSLCSSLEMHILEVFLHCDVRYHYKSYLDLVHDRKFYGATGNTTCIEKQEEYIYLSDNIFLPENDEELLKLKIPIKEYVNLITTWGTKIFTDDSSKRPSEVIIWYENEKFFFDIKQ